MNRRRFLSALSTASALSGCSTIRSDDDSVRFEIAAARLYQLQRGTFATIVDLDRRGTQAEEQTVHLRWEFDSRVDGVRRAIERRVVVVPDDTKPRVTNSWTSDGNEEKSDLQDSQVKIIRHGANDSAWVATARGSNGTAD